MLKTFLALALLGAASARAGQANKAYIDPRVADLVGSPWSRFWSDPNQKAYYNAYLRNGQGRTAADYVIRQRLGLSEPDMQETLANMFPGNSCSAALSDTED
jgi:hypothetical protein